MHYKDLSPYPDASKGEGHTLSVGWLTKKQFYSKGEVSQLFVERLWRFCSKPIFYMLGYHNCPFCRNLSFGVVVKFGDEEVNLGSAEIRVIGKDNVIYAAPDLIYHYVTKHNYRPPDEFIQAVLDGPLPDTPEYEEFARKYNWHR